MSEIVNVTPKPIVDVVPKPTTVGRIVIVSFSSKPLPPFVTATVTVEPRPAPLSATVTVKIAPVPSGSVVVYPVDRPTFFTT